MFFPTISQVARRVARLLFAVSVQVPRRIAGMKMNPLRLAGIAALAVPLLAAMPLAAQTAHFNSAIRTLGSGFSEPLGVAVDASGNVFVADGNNNAVKEILAAGGYTTTVNILATGLNGPAGVAVDASGNVFVADTYNNAVKEILAAGGYTTTVNILATGLNGPAGVAVDGSGNVFVADYNDNAVKEILAAGGYTTVNTLGSGFSQPFGVAVDGSGNVFVGDSTNNAVKEILAAGGYTTVNTLGSGFYEPQGVAVDASGNVYIADKGNKAVKEILAAGGYTTINTLGSGFNGPSGVAVDASGNVFVADSNNNAVKEIFAAGGNFGAVKVTGPGPIPISLYFTFDTAGTLGSTAVLTQGAAGLDFIDAGGDTCTANTAYTAGSTCTVNVAFQPTARGTRYGAAELLASSGNLLATGYVQGTGIAPLVNFLPGTQSTLGSGFNAPVGVAVDGSGNVFVADANNSMVKEILAAGGYTTVNTLGSGFNDPTGVAVDGSGNVFVADGGNNAVKEILAAGGYTTVNTLGSGFSEPYGVAVDGSGNVFVGDYHNNAVKEILAAGGYTTVNTLGSGFSGPFGVAVDGNDNVFVGDTDNNAVKEILAAGGYTTVNTLGSGFSTPSGVAVDARGNVFVADTGNNRVAKLDYADPPALSFASTAVGVESSDSPQTVTVSNNGNADLTLPVPAAGNNPSISSGFTLDNATTCPQLSATSSAAGTLAPGTNCTYAVDFIPAVAAANSGALVLTDNNLNAAAPNYATQSISLSGMGLLVPAATLAPASLIFSAQLAGTTSAPQTATLSNSGTLLTISGITITGANAGDFKENGCGATLAGGANCKIQVTYTPSVGGAESATLTVTDNSGGVAGSTQTVALSGTGQDFSITATTSSMTITAGQTANISLQVTPEGGWTGSVSFACSGAPLLSTCSVSPSPLSVMGVNSVDAMLTITTTSRGTLVPMAPEVPTIPRGAVWLGLLALLGTAALARMRGFRPQAAGLGLLALLMALVLSVASVSCGPSHHGTPAGTYMLKVMATSGTLSNEVTLNLTVQ